VILLSVQCYALHWTDNKYDDDDDTVAEDDYTNPVKTNAANDRGAHPAAAPASSLHHDLTLIDNDLYE